MRIINFSDARNNLKQVIDGVVEDADVAVIADRKSTRLNSSHEWISRMPSSA